MRMGKLSLAFILSTVILISACNRLPQGDVSLVTMGQGTGIDTPMPPETPTPGNIESVQAISDTLSAIATQEFETSATSEVWADLPINMGTPTVPAPRPDGLDLADPSSWQRYMDATGFLFDYLVNAVVTPLEPISGPPELGGTMQVRQKESDESVASIEAPIVVAMTRTDIDAIASSPSTTDQGEANWLMQLPFSDAAQTKMFVRGRINDSPNPVNVDFWNGMSPILYVIVFDEACDAAIILSSSFGAIGPAADALFNPLDQVVAEHFPVLDHMYRSVEFPPDCS